MADSDAAPPTTMRSKRRLAQETNSENRVAKKRRNKAPRDIIAEDLDIEMGLNNGIAHMNSHLLSDYIAQRTKRFQPDLTMVELEESYIPG